MDLVIEVLSVLWLVFKEMTSFVITTIWENIPLILELRKIAGLLTPTGIIATIFGVSPIIISIIKFILKR